MKTNTQNNNALFLHEPHTNKMCDPLKTLWNDELLQQKEQEELLKLIDFSQMNTLFENFLQGVGLPVSIIDLNGTVLATSKWQRLCIDFHRVNEKTLQRCLENDRSIYAQLEENKSYSSCRCKNGLIDCAAPIVIEGQHIANLFIGQFFIATPNLEFFKKQQQEFGFDEIDYFAAISEVPVVNKKRLPAIMALLVSWAEDIAVRSLAENRASLLLASVEKQAKERTQQLERSNAELEQFAYAVSHDMRQPLRMVTSYLNLLEAALQTKLNEDTQAFLNFAIDGAKRMDSMILSLLDYSRVGNKTQAFDFISSRQCVDEATLFLKTELEKTHGVLEVTGAWIELAANRDELTRLLQNLIGNALKYHDEKQPPHVKICASIVQNNFHVEVKDNGIGIEPSQMERLFKVFSRLQSRSRFEGTGVGLALCRKIVEHHGGKIGVHSDGEGCGCTFWFEIPLQVITEQELNEVKKISEKEVAL